jgi:hypothetical protein
LIGQRRPAVKPGGVAKRLREHAPTIALDAKTVAAVAQAERHGVHPQRVAGGCGWRIHSAMRNNVTQQEYVQLVANGTIRRPPSPPDEVRVVPRTS